MRTLGLAATILAVSFVAMSCGATPPEGYVAASSPDAPTETASTIVPGPTSTVVSTEEPSESETTQWKIRDTYTVSVEIPISWIYDERYDEIADEGGVSFLGRWATGECFCNVVLVIQPDYGEDWPLWKAEPIATYATASEGDWLSIDTSNGEGLNVLSVLRLPDNEVALVTSNGLPDEMPGVAEMLASFTVEGRK